MSNDKFCECLKCSVIRANAVNIIVSLKSVGIEPIEALHVAACVVAVIKLHSIEGVDEALKDMIDIEYKRLVLMENKFYGDNVPLDPKFDFRQWMKSHGGT